MARIDLKAWAVEKKLGRQMSPLMERAVKFHFTRRDNRLKRGETPEQHAKRVRPGLEASLTSNIPLSILTEIVMASQEVKQLKLPFRFDSNEQKQDVIRGVIDGGIGKFGEKGGFLDEVIERGVKHELTLAHFLSDVGGVHNAWFRKRLPEALLEYVRNKERSKLFSN